jgi:protein TonB
MRASRLAAEPAWAERPALRATPPRLARSRSTRRKWRVGGLLSAIMHAAALALLLLGAKGSTKTEEQAAPTFAVEFTNSGEPVPGPSAPTSQPQVNLGGPEMAPPLPEDQPAEPLPIPVPARRYGNALRPKANRNPFANIVPFDLNPQQHRSLAAGNGRSLDLSAGPVIRNGALQDSVEHVRGTHGMSDWQEQLQEFVEEHKYYPREAADNGEQGAAVLHVTVGRDGTVKRLTLLSSSGSHLLDAAWMAVFRDNKLPPFNDDMSGNEVTFNYELDYHLIYGR